MSTPEVQPISDQVNRLQRWFQAVITHADGVDSGAGSEEALSKPYSSGGSATAAALREGGRGFLGAVTYECGSSGSCGFPLPRRSRSK